jgi:hypothetical protein
VQNNYTKLDKLSCRKLPMRTPMNLWKPLNIYLIDTLLISLPVPKFSLRPLVVVENESVGVPIVSASFGIWTLGWRLTCETNGNISICVMHRSIRAGFILADLCAMHRSTNIKPSHFEDMFHKWIIHFPYKIFISYIFLMFSTLNYTVTFPYINFTHYITF